jgi:hypothetical protein
MTSYIARVTHQGGTLFLTISENGRRIATHTGTPRQFERLAMGLDVVAHEAREKRDIVRFMIPDKPGGKTGTSFELTPEYTESLADEVRRGILRIAGEMKMSRQAERQKPLIERINPSLH